MPICNKKCTWKGKFSKKVWFNFFADWHFSVKMEKLMILTFLGSKDSFHQIYIVNASKLLPRTTSFLQLAVKNGVHEWTSLFLLSFLGSDKNSIVMSQLDPWQICSFSHAAFEQRWFIRRSDRPRPSIQIRSPLSKALFFIKWDIFSKITLLNQTKSSFHLKA